MQTPRNKTHLTHLSTSQPLGQKKRTRTPLENPRKTSKITKPSRPPKRILTRKHWTRTTGVGRHHPKKPSTKQLPSPSIFNLQLVWYLTFHEFPNKTDFNIPKAEGLCGPRENQAIIRFVHLRTQAAQQRSSD